MLSCLSPRKPLLGTKRSRDVCIAECCKCVQRMNQITRNGRGVREQRYAASRQRAAQFGFIEESINAKLHVSFRLKLKRKSIGVVEVRLALRVTARPIAQPTILLFYDRSQGQLGSTRRACVRAER